MCTCARACMIGLKLADSAPNLLYYAMLLCSEKSAREAFYYSHPKFMLLN